MMVNVSEDRVYTAAEQTTLAHAASLLGVPVRDLYSIPRQPRVAQTQTPQTDGNDSPQDLIEAAGGLPRGVGLLTPPDQASYAAAVKSSSRHGENQVQDAPSRTEFPNATHARSSLAALSAVNGVQPQPIESFPSQIPNSSLAWSPENLPTQINNGQTRHLMAQAYHNLDPTQAWDPQDVSTLCNDNIGEVIPSVFVQDGIPSQTWNQQRIPVRSSISNIEEIFSAPTQVLDSISHSTSPAFAEVLSGSAHAQVGYDRPGPDRLPHHSKPSNIPKSGLSFGQELTVTNTERQNDWSQTSGFDGVPDVDSNTATTTPLRPASFQDLYFQMLDSTGREIRHEALSHAYQCVNDHLNITPIPSSNLLANTIYSVNNQNATIPALQEPATNLYPWGSSDLSNTATLPTTASLQPFQDEGDLLPNPPNIPYEQQAKASLGIFPPNNNRSEIQPYGGFGFNAGDMSGYAYACQSWPATMQPSAASTESAPACAYDMLVQMPAGGSDEFSQFNDQDLNNDNAYPDLPQHSMKNSAFTPGGVSHNQAQKVEKRRAEGSQRGFGGRNRKEHLKKRPFADPVKRMETAEVRKAKACLRCHMQRIRCVKNPNDPTGPCLTCAKLMGPTRSGLPCLRYKVTDTTLFQSGDHPQFIWSRRWKVMKIVDITSWGAPDVKKISITQDIGGLSYQIEVREFIPLEGDSLERRWVTNGVQNSHPCAPYAIVNMKQTGATMIQFLNSAIETSIQHYINGPDRLLNDTYVMALKHSKVAKRDLERELLRLVLQLWVAVRMGSRSDRICGDETLGMTPQDHDPECHNFRHVLVPPVISAQCELINTVMVLQPLKQAVLKKLHFMIKEKKTRSWFTIYLALFILLHNCSLLTAFEHKQARKYGLKTRYVYESVVEELHNGTKILLAYFHYCNGGIKPLAMDWTHEGNISLGEFNQEQVQFMKASMQQVRDKLAEFKFIQDRQLFEDDFYFLSQLYDVHWKPSNTV